MASEFHCHLFPPSALISVLELLDLPERFWQMSEMWDGGKVWEEDRAGGKSRMIFAMMFGFHQRKPWVGGCGSMQLCLSLKLGDDDQVVRVHALAHVYTFTYVRACALCFTHSLTYTHTRASVMQDYLTDKTGLAPGCRYWWCQC